MNDIWWRIFIVDQNDPVLVDRTGVLTVATTDPVNHAVYLSKSLRGDFLFRVLIHELAHCAMVSYNMIDEIRRIVKMEYWIEAEEYICNFIADYGLKIFSIGYARLGYKAWEFVPKELEKLIS